MISYSYTNAFYLKYAAISDILELEKVTMGEVTFMVIQDH